jgi:repressor LexA
MSKKPASNSKPSNVTELPDSAAGEHGLTARQIKILEVIQQGITADGCPPSMRAIAAAAGLSIPRLGQIPARDLAGEEGFITAHPTRGGVLNSSPSWREI